MEESCGSAGWELVFSGTRGRSAPLPAHWQLQARFSATTAGGSLGHQSIQVSVLASPEPCGRSVGKRSVIIIGEFLLHGREEPHLLDLLS